MILVVILLLIVCLIAGWNNRPRKIEDSSSLLNEQESDSGMFI